MRPDPGVTAQTRLYAERAEQLARSLLAETALPPPAGRRALVALIGLPGSGKSHLGRLLAARLGAVVVASDQLRRRIFVAPSYGAGESAMVFAIAHAMARELLARDHAVIFDATNLRERDRRPLYEIAEQIGARLVLVRIYAPEAEIYARLGRRRLRGIAEDQHPDRPPLGPREAPTASAAPWLGIASARSAGKRSASGVGAGAPPDASDADERVYAAMRDRYEEPRRPYLVVDTTGDLAAAVERVAACVEDGCA